MRTSPARDSKDLESLASGLSKSKHANSMLSDIAQKRYYLAKERKRLENQYNEKITKLSNEHKRQVDDLVAEKTLKFQDLELQEDEIDFQESQSAALFPHSPVSDRVQLAAPFVDPEVKIEPIYISDDEDTVMTDASPEEKQSYIIMLKYKRENIGALNTNSIVKSVEPHGRHVHGGSPKTKYNLRSNRISVASEKLTIIDQHKIPLSGRPVTPTRKPVTKASETPTFKLPLQGRQDYLTPSPSIKFTSPIAAREGTAALLEEAADIPLLEGPRATRSRAPDYRLFSSEATYEEREELGALFVQQTILQLYKHVSLLRKSACLAAFLLKMDQEVCSPSRFFQYYMNLIHSKYSVHRNCCTGRLRSESGWNYTVTQFLRAEECQFGECMEHCETEGFDHEHRMEIVEDWFHVGSAASSE